MDFILTMIGAAWSVLKFGFGISIFVWMLIPGKKGGRAFVKRLFRNIAELIKEGYIVLRMKLHREMKKGEPNTIQIDGEDIRYLTQQEFEDMMLNHKSFKLD